VMVVWILEKEVFGSPLLFLVVVQCSDDDFGVGMLLRRQFRCSWFLPTVVSVDYGGGSW
jgi:hypothetical protein